MTLKNKLKENNTLNELLIHLTIWGIVLSIPLFVLTSQEIGDLSGRFWKRWIPIALLPIVFYINYFVLVPKLLFQKKHWLYIIAVIVLVLLALWLEAQFRGIFDVHHHRPRPPRGSWFKPIKQEFIVREILTFIMMTGLSTAVRVTYRWFRVEKEKEQLQKEHLHSELALLKHQLNPHFFFNTLNNIYALIEINQSDAQKAVHKLSKMMRYLLYEADSEMITLQQEINFLNTYIDLMKLRLTDKVHLDIIFPTSISNIKIPPLLLVTFVENAFKHGVSYQGDSFIRIRCFIDDNSLIFETENSIFKKEDEINTNHSGIGLQNIRKRLDLLYPDKYAMDIFKDDKIYKINLKIDTSQ